MSATEQAVQNCVKAYCDARDREDPQNPFFTEKGWAIVCHAYRHAMPFLTSDPDAIDAFIACVTHGLIIEVFEPAEASKLLYAAQVAITSRRARTQAARQQPKSESQPKPAPQPASKPKPAPTPLPLGDNSVAESATSQVPAPLPLCPSAPASPTPHPPSVDHSVTLPLCNSVTPDPTPIPPATSGAEGAAAAPRVPRKAMQAARNQVDAILEQLLAGKVPVDRLPEHFEPAAKAAPAKQPPTPTPNSRTQQSLRAAI
jgi:hypothetical protein